MNGPIFPKVCRCSIKEIAHELPEYSVPKVDFESGGSSYLLTSDIPTKERVAFTLSAISPKEYEDIVQHYHDCRGTFALFEFPIKHYAQHVYGARRWIGTIKNKNGRWRYQEKPQTPRPEPGVLSISIILESEN